MIIFVVGKKEKIWNILKNQYNGHTLIEISPPPFINISDGEKYENEYYIQQINNTSKIINQSALFVTYNTVVNIKNINERLNTLFVCNKLKKTFGPFTTQGYTTIDSYEIISNACIEYNGDIINVFQKEQKRLLHNILNIIFKDKIQLYDDFNIETDEKDKLFFIPSIIVPHNKSTFIPIDRYQQTLEQLKSIRKHDKFNKSILLEMSDINNLSFDIIIKFLKHGDHVILFGYDEEFQKIARDSNKNKGEIELLRYILPHFTKKKFSHLYKFGGRYSLDNDFQHLYESNFGMVCKRIHSSKNAYNQDIIEPVIYSISQNKLYSFIEVLQKMHMHLEYEVNDVERMLIWVTDVMSVKYVDRLCVSGKNASNCIYRNL